MIRGKSIYHCHGKEKGKIYRTYETHAKAVAAHKAIMVNENAVKNVKKYLKGK